MDERIDKIVENSLTSLTYPRTKIRDYCFYQNSALETFIAPNITDLGTFSFAYSGVKNIQFDELENEGASASAFVGSALETGHFAKLTEIPNTFFRQCSNLQTVETDEDITKIGTESYAYSGITEASFPALTNAGAGVGAFEGSALENGSFPLFTALPNSFFRYCHLLKTLPLDNVTTFGNYSLQKWATVEHPLADTSMFTNVIIDMESQPEGTIVTFGDGALAGNINQTGANAPANHIARVYTGDAWYEGLVADVPEGSTVDVYEPYYTVGSGYRDAEHTKTITVQEGSMVIVESTGRPYVYRSGGWTDYIPKYSADYGDTVCSNNRMRDLGFKVHSSTISSFDNKVSNTTCVDNILFMIVDKDYVGTSFSANGAKGLKYLRFEQPDGTLSNVYPFTSTSGSASGAGSFRGTQVYDLDFSNVQIVGMYSLGHNSAVTTYNLPNVVSIVGGNSTITGTTMGSCSSLESIYLGDGTSTLTINNAGIWAYNSNLTILSLNYTAVVPFTNAEDYYKNNLKFQLQGTPIYQYKGTTTTTIANGSTVNPILIYGNSYTAMSGDIVTYNDKQWQYKSNKWTEWGTDGNRRPRVLVPTSLVPSYVTDFCEYAPDDSRYFEKWGNLSPEVYYDEFSNVTPSMPTVDDSFSPVNLVDISGGVYTNMYLIESISAIDVTNATDVKVELYHNGVLEQTIPITGACNIFRGLIGANDSVRATLSWSGSLSVSWQTLVMWNT